MESITQQSANNAVEKLFGDGNDDLKNAVLMEMTLDADDEEEQEMKKKYFRKLAKEHEKDEFLMRDKIWNIHDDKGNLIPHIYQDGQFKKYESNLNDGGDKIS